MNTVCEVLQWANLNPVLWSMLVLAIGMLLGVFGMSYSDRKWLLAGNPLWYKGKAYYLSKEGLTTPQGLEQ